MTRVVASCSNTRGLLERLSPDGFSGRTSPEFCRRTGGQPLVPSSGCWKTAGILSHGECWTLNSSEYPSAAAACFLSDILEPSAPQRFYLSPRACRGLLRRARTKERSLPPELEEAFRLGGIALNDHNPDAVVLGFDTTLTYEKLEKEYDQQLPPEIRLEYFEKVDFRRMTEEDPDVMSLISNFLNQCLPEAEESAAGFF